MNTIKEDSIKQKEGDNNKNNWENKTSGNKEPSWYANIEQPIKFGKLAYNISSSFFILFPRVPAFWTTFHKLPLGQDSQNR
jgi:hypothetical protein